MGWFVPFTLSIPLIQPNRAIFIGFPGVRNTWKQLGIFRPLLLGWSNQRHKTLPLDRDHGLSKTTITSSIVEWSRLPESTETENIQRHQELQLVSYEWLIMMMGFYTCMRWMSPRDKRNTEKKTSRIYHLREPFLCLRVNFCANKPCFQKDIDSSSKPCKPSQNSPFIFSIHVGWNLSKKQHLLPSNGWNEKWFIFRSLQKGNLPSFRIKRDVSCFPKNVVLSCPSSSNQISCMVKWKIINNSKFWANYYNS